LNPSNPQYLPIDILLKITDFIQLTDTMRMRKACKSWNEILRACSSGVEQSLSCFDEVIFIFKQNIKILTKTTAL
jgi:hypothetical protein